MLLGLFAVPLPRTSPQRAAAAPLRTAPPIAQQRQITLSPDDLALDDEKVEQLFAWLNMAFSGDMRYNNLMLAFAAVFGGDGSAELVCACLMAQLYQLSADEGLARVSAYAALRDTSHVGALAALTDAQKQLCRDLVRIRRASDCADE